MTVAFKNAFKIMVDRFGLVWMLLLYIFILAVVLVSVSMAFMIPIYRIFLGGGIIEEFYALFKSIVGGDSINAWFEQIRNIGQSVSDLFAENNCGCFGLQIFDRSLRTPADFCFGRLDVVERADRLRRSTRFEAR